MPRNRSRRSSRSPAATGRAAIFAADVLATVWSVISVVTKAIPSNLVPPHGYNLTEDRRGPQIAGIPLDSPRRECWMTTMLKQ
jgi:hypothetical protein